MSDPGSAAQIAELKDEIARLNKIIAALMDRAEASSGAQNSDFGLFQTAIMLEDQVSTRTAELSGALREIENINSALRESEEKFRSVVSHSMIGIAIIEGGRFSYSNSRFEAIFGYRGDELRAIAPSKLVVSGERSFAEQTMAAQLSGSDGEVSVLGRAVRRDGAIIDVEVRGSAMTIAGHPALIVLVNDVSERMRDARRIESLVQEQNAILNSRVVGFVKLKERRFVWANAAAAEILGYAQDELIGQPTRVIYADEASYQAFSSAYPEIARGEVAHREMRYRRRNGTYGWFKLDGAQLHPGSDESIWSVVDVTERNTLLAEIEQHRHHLEELVAARTAELATARDAAQAASRAKSVFLSTMSHELRTPMNGIMGMSSLALARARDPLQIDYLNKGMTASRQLLAIINNIIDIAQIEAERMTLDESDFALRQIIGESLAQEETQARAKGLRLTMDVASVLPRTMRGDALRLRQILANFVGNAVKFSEQGQIAVRARALHEDSQSILLRIEVSDQGIGLSPAEQQQLFSAYTQVDGTSTRRYGGTGLGLIIAKRLAQLMGGDAGVISAPGVGSTFWANVRLRQAATTSGDSGP